MYIQKLADAAASLITVTSTATSLYDLIDTAGGSNSELGSKNLNACDLTIEDGDVRMLIDGNTPTSANGVLLSSGNTYYFRGIPLSKMKLIRVSGDVAVSVQVGTSELSESSSSSAHDVTLEAGSVTIGDVGITSIAGSTAQALGIDAVGADAYATVVTPSADATHIKASLDGSNDAIISLDAGTTDHIYITAGEVAILDQIAITSGTAIQAKNATPGSNYSNLTLTIW